MKRVGVRVLLWMTSAGWLFILGSSVSAETFKVTNIERNSEEALQLWFRSDNPGAPGFVVEHATTLGPGSDWARIAVGISDLSDQTYLAGPLPMYGDKSFYRVAEAETITAWMDAAEIEVSENSGSIELIIHFNCYFRGVINYTIGGTIPGLFANPNGSVMVEGSVAVIIINLVENTSIDGLRNIWIDLSPAAGLLVSSPASATVTIQDNDAMWYGLFESDQGGLGFELLIIDDGFTVQGSLGGDGGFFSNGPYEADVLLNDTQFSTTITGIALPVESNLLGAPTTMTFSLSADEDIMSGGPQLVDDRVIQGSALLTTEVEGMDYLNTTTYGSFILQRTPTGPAESEPDLVYVP